MITYRTGNLFDSIKEFTDNKQKVVIPHVVNNKGFWNKGFVLSINQHDPGQKSLYAKEIMKHVKNPYKALGSTLLCSSTIGANVFFAHMFAQTGIRSNLNPHPLCYQALQDCLESLYEKIGKWNNTRILAPKFGAGLAGGQWPVIEKIIQKTIINTEVYIYTL